MKNIKKSIIIKMTLLGVASKIILIVAALFISSGSAFAQIAVVDSQYIFENSKLTKQANAKIKKLTKEAQEKVKTEEDALTKKQGELMAKKSVLSTDAYSKKEKELRKEILDFRKHVKKLQNELSIKNKLEMQDIAKKISVVVNKLAKEKGYEVVVSKGILMYSNDKAEITKQVLKVLDSEDKE
ncbi:MAG: OmpH family outer membrane protein [Proteobacteria bacterium]|nr:OmpH family outer membrane protein [Pseudomonadota bacterium]